MKVRLTELGPRMNLRLVKIEEGLSGGAVLYHSYKSKTEEEKMQMEEKINKAAEDKQERIRQQNQNVAAKQAAADKKKKEEEKKKRKDEAATKARVVRSRFSLKSLQFLFFSGAHRKTARWKRRKARKEHGKEARSCPERWKSPAETDSELVQSAL